MPAVRLVVVGLALGATACGRIGFADVDGAAGPGGDGGPGDTGGDAPASACGGTILADDGFDDSTPGPVFAVSTGAGLTVVEGASELQVTLGASVSATQYAYYRTTTSYPAEGLCATVEVLGTPDTAAPGAAIYMKLRTAQREVEMFEYGGTLELRIHASTTITIVGSMPWDPVADRYLRLRQQVGTTYWDTSSDGVVFTERHAEPAAFPVSTAQLELGAGARLDTSNGGTARFGSARISGP